MGKHDIFVTMSQMSYTTNKNACCQHTSEQLLFLEKQFSSSANSPPSLTAAEHGKWKKNDVTFQHKNFPIVAIKSGNFCCLTVVFGEVFWQ
jgi:hypothetical protein